jgi:hypothetical protein
MRDYWVQRNPAFVNDLRRGRTLEYLSKKYGKAVGTLHEHAKTARKLGLAPERTMTGPSVMQRLRRGGLPSGNYSQIFDGLPKRVVLAIEADIMKEPTVALGIQAILIEHARKLEEASNDRPHEVQPPAPVLGGGPSPGT